MMQYFNKNKEKMRKIKQFCKFVKVDFSFILLFIVSFLIDDLKLYLWNVVFVILHELSHLLVSKKLGYLPKKIHLTFFGASLEGDDDFLIQDEIKIILAGPILNFFVIIFCYLMFWFKPESYIFLSDILIANWSIFLFNMLPIFPLDFGRILLVFFNKKYDRKQALLKVKKVSIFVVGFLFCVYLVSCFFVFNFTLGFVAVNLFCLTVSNTSGTSFKRQLFVDLKLKKINRGLIERVVYVEQGCENFKLYKFIDEYHYFKFVFLDKNGDVSGVLYEKELYEKDGLI